MTETNMPLTLLLQKHDEGDFLCAVTEAMLQTLMEYDVEGLIGAGRYERGEGRQTYRNGSRDRKLKTRMGALNLRVPKLRADWLRPLRHADFGAWVRPEGLPRPFAGLHPATGLDRRLVAAL